MAEPKKTKKKPVRALPEGAQELGAGALSATAATDPFLSRNEFKPGFYTQKDQPPVTAELS